MIKKREASHTKRASLMLLPIEEPMTLLRLPTRQKRRLQAPLAPLPRQACPHNPAAGEQWR